MLSIKAELKYLISIFIIFGIIYTLTINQCLTIVIDAAGYAGEIANCEINFFPHHLLYHVAFLYWSDFLKLFGMTNVVQNIGIFNAIFASLSISVIYLILRQRFGIGRPLSIAYLFLPGFSFGFWIVGTSANVYMLPLFCLLTCYYLFLEMGNSRKKWLLIGFFHSIAILFNQWNIFFFPAIFISVLFLKDRKELLKNAFLVYIGVLFVLVVGVYILIAVLHENVRSVSDLFNWLTYYSQRFPWTTSIKGIIKDASIGIGQTMLAPYWMFGSDIFAPLLTKIIPGHVSLAEEAFFARNVSNLAGIIYLILTMASLTGLGFIFTKVLGNLKAFFKDRDIRALFIIFWVITSSIMPLFWSGYNQRYWFTQTTIFYLIGLLIFSKDYRNSWKKYIPFFTGVTMFVLTLFSTMIPATDKQNDLTYHKLMSMGNEIRPGDLVIHHGIWNFGHYIKIYRTGTDEFRADNLIDEQKMRDALEFLNAIDKRLEKHNVYMFKEVVSEAGTYPPEISKLLEHILEKYKLETQYHDTKYIDYYVIRMK
jgi:hypothetical protein